MHLLLDLPHKTFFYENSKSYYEIFFVHCFYRFYNKRIYYLNFELNSYVIFDISFFSLFLFNVKHTHGYYEPVLYFKLKFII